ncbi:hypothetical protein KI387_024073, partial [Taxus chinensis]
MSGSRRSGGPGGIGPGGSSGSSGGGNTKGNQGSGSEGQGPQPPPHAFFEMSLHLPNYMGIEDVLEHVH